MTDVAQFHVMYQEQNKVLIKLLSAPAKCCGLSTNSVFTLRFVIPGQNAVHNRLPQRVNEKQTFLKKKAGF